MSATIPTPPPLSLTFVGQAPEPVAYQYAGQRARVDAFNLVERAVLRALCLDVLRAIEDHENPLIAARPEQDAA